MTTIKEALKCKEQYDAVKNYCLLSKANATMEDDDWAAGFAKVRKAQDKLNTFLDSSTISAIIIHRDELIEKFNW